MRTEVGKKKKKFVLELQNQNQEHNQNPETAAYVSQVFALIEFRKLE